MTKKEKKEKEVAVCVLVLLGLLAMGIIGYGVGSSAGYGDGLTYNHAQVTELAQELADANDYYQACDKYAMTCKTTLEQCEYTLETIG